MWGRLETCGRLSIGLPGNPNKLLSVYEPAFPTNGVPNEETDDHNGPGRDPPRGRLVARFGTTHQAARDAHARKRAPLRRGVRLLAAAARMERLQGQDRLARERQP